MESALSVLITAEQISSSLRGFAFASGWSSGHPPKSHSQVPDPHGFQQKSGKSFPCFFRRCACGDGGNQRVRRELPLEGFHAAESLEIGILPPFLHNALIAKIRKLFEQKQSRHEPNGFRRPVPFSIKGRIQQYAVS